MPACADYRGFWLWLCGWLLAASFATWHAVAVERYLDRVTATRFTDEVLETPLKRVPQAIAPDGQVWVRHALGLAETGAWRLRTTEIDNAPDGRSIYWNSGWALWLEACGRVRKAFTGEPLATAIEEASLWANLPFFLIVITLASFSVWQRWGDVAGAWTALALVGHRGFYAAFYPAYCDHHGLISATVLGVVLSALLGGAGWRTSDGHMDVSMLPKTNKTVMRSMVVSAICGAIGLWVSAASLVMTIAFTGGAGLVVGLMLGGKAPGSFTAVPHAWRLWGRIGATLSVAFYLVENFPDRLGWRLEVNHPLYALAWWAAGELIAVIIEWRIEARPLKWLAVRAAGWSAPVLAVPLIIWGRGVAVFGPLDPFLGRIHESIHEFQPWWVEASKKGWGVYGDQVIIVAGILNLLGIWVVKRPSRDERAMVLFSSAVALLALLLGLYQNRWLLTGSAPQVVLAVFLVATFSMRNPARGWTWSLVGAGLLLFISGPWTLARERLHVEQVRDVQLGETMQLLYRDIAGFLGKAGANEKSIVLSDPNASVGVGYYGRLRTVGTLYWENRDGLLAAAEILSARDEADAAARIYARGITHVVLISSYDFLPEYNYALRGGDGPVEDRTTLGYRLLYGHQVPVWLRPLNYRVPTPLAPLGFKVAVFAVDFEAPVSIAHERIGRYQLSLGERRLAEASFMAAMTADVSRPEPWLRLGELALASGRVKEAFNFVRAGIERVPAAERGRLVRDAATLFRSQGPEGAEQADALLGIQANPQ
ncbi:hypothetical protein RAHE111665_15415 [Rariglobus hedericola]